MSNVDTRARPRPVRADLVITAVAALLFAWALWASFEWSFNAAVFPRMVAVTGLAMALLNLVVLVALPAGQTTPAPQDAPDDGAASIAEPGYDFATAGRRAWFTNIGWVLAFFAGTYVFGLFLTSPFFALAYLRFGASTSWRVAVVNAVVIAAVLFGIFDQLLQIPMPLGVIQE